jgi:aryl-alcohol dehydrogenase-like predicted oxidoreductase
VSCYLRISACTDTDSINYSIPGTTNLARLEENVNALKIQLSKEEEQEIRKACENAEVSGHRYPPAFAAALFASTPKEE